MLCSPWAASPLIAGRSWLPRPGWLPGQPGRGSDPAPGAVRCLAAQPPTIDVIPALQMAAPHVQRPGGSGSVGGQHGVVLVLGCLADPEAQIVGRPSRF